MKRHSAWVFLSLAVSGSGLRLPPAQVRACIVRARSSFATPEEAFFPMDTDNNHLVDRAEFTRAVGGASCSGGVQAEAAFAAADADHDGALSPQEFFSAVGKDGSMSEWAPTAAASAEDERGAQAEAKANLTMSEAPVHKKPSLFDSPFAEPTRKAFRAIAALTGQERVALAARCVPDYNAVARKTYKTPKEAFWPMDEDYDNMVEPSEWTSMSEKLEVEPTESWMAFLSIDANDDRRLTPTEFFEAVGENGSPNDWAPEGTTGPGAKPPKNFQRPFDDSHHWEDYVEHKDQHLPADVKAKLKKDNPTIA